MFLNINAVFILITGASPMEMDYKRRLRAEQWARFCGRHSCAEIFEKCSRTRPLDKEIPIKWSHDTQSANQENEKFMIKGRARANSAIQTSSKISTTTTSISCKTTNDSGKLKQFEHSTTFTIFIYPIYIFLSLLYMYQVFDQRYQRFLILCRETRQTIKTTIATIIIANKIII